MSPTSPAPSTMQPVVNSGPTPPPPPKLVDNIPLHTPGQTAAPPDEDAELDKIMQDVGREMQQTLAPKPKRHFWKLGHQTAKEVKPKSTVAAAATPKAPAPSKTRAAQPNLAPALAQPTMPAKASPKSPDQAAFTKPKRHFPLAVTALTILVTAALIAAAYYTYK